MIQNCISLESPSEWKGALKGMRHAFAHTWENCYAMHLTTGFTTYLYCFETEDTRIICPIAERIFNDRLDIVTPYGFSGFIGNNEYHEFSHQWRIFVREKGYVCGYIGLNPILANNNYFEPEEMYQYNSVYVLDLTLSLTELFANLNENRKRQLKDWDKLVSSIILEKNIVKDFFLDNYHDFFQAKRTSSVYNFSNKTLSFLADLDNVLIVGAQRSGKMEAVSVFAYTPDVGEYLFNVSLPEGRHFSTLLLWYGVNHLRSLKIPLLNLGGGVRENDGVGQFKERFGGKKLPLRCLKQIYDPESYAELCLQVNTSPDNVSGYFPSYRKP